MFKSSFMKHVILCLASLITSLSHAQLQDHPNANYAIYKPITFDEITDIAYMHRKDLESFDYIIRGNWHTERAALGGFLPQINIIADSGTSSRAGISGFGQIPVESIGVNISQLLFSYNGPLFQYKIAQEETNISKAKREQLENSIRFGAESAFLESKKILLKHKVIENLDKSSNLTFSQNISRQKVGFLNRAQWKNAQAVYLQEQADVKNYPSDIHVEISKLQREVNAPVNPELISLDYEGIEEIVLLPIRIQILLN